jgi:enoyl-CoA hydratase
METKELKTVIYEKDGPIARIILNYPEKANAQTSQLVYDVDEALGWADRDYDVKVLILKANGKGFGSGHAISDNMEDVYPDYVRSIEATGSSWKGGYDMFVWPVMRIWEFMKPTISQIHGYCLGGTTHWGLTTDIVIASDDAYFQYPVLQGLGMPGGQCTIEPWIFMNWHRAAEYLYTSQKLSADEALEFGLVNKVVPRDELEDAVEQMARHIAQAPLSTLMMAKQNIKRAWEHMGMRVHWQSSADLVALASASRDVQEMIGPARERGLKPAHLAAEHEKAAAGNGGGASQAEPTPA